MTIDPLLDPRWSLLLDSHREASVFHTPAWLEALRRTYGYYPVVFTTSPLGEPLENGIAFCRVESWLTGSRLVSVPFSDHCQPLVDNGERLAILLDEVQQHRVRQQSKYAELRLLVSNGAGASELLPFEKSSEYCFHRLDMRPDLDTLYGSFHKSCIQRKIQRAERQRLEYDAGRSELILAKFYHLLMITRRRHHVPPQPMAWFRNLIGCLGESVTIRVASKDARPVAGILTLRYKKTLVYKYGGSDAGAHGLGGMPFLFWKAIQESKEHDIEELDLGRSDLDDAGLIAFKDHLGALRSTLTYYKSPALGAARRTFGWNRRLARKTLPLIPDPLLKMAGLLLYRHIG